MGQVLIPAVFLQMSSVLIYFSSSEGDYCEALGNSKRLFTCGNKRRTMALMRKRGRRNPSPLYCVDGCFVEQISLRR